MTENEQKNMACATVKEALLEQYGKDNVLKKLREYLAERGWSLYMLCKMSGATKSNVYYTFRENAMPALPELALFCNAFGLTLSAFFEQLEAEKSAKV